MFYKNEIGLLIVLPFVLNLIFNAVFTPLQFGLKNNWLAAVDIVLILLTLVWLVAVIFPHAQWIAYMQIPYLIWVSIATVLQLSIVYLNEGHLPKKS